MKNTFKLLYATLMITLCVSVYAYAGAQNKPVLDTVIELPGITTAGIVVTAFGGNSQPAPSAPAQMANQPSNGGSGGSGSAMNSGNASPGQPVFLRPVIPSAKVTIVSPPDAGGAAAPTQIYIWNQDYLQNTLTNGGVALTYNFEDGFNGNLTSRKISGEDGGPASTLYGIYIRALADGVADPTGLSNTEPSILKYTGRGVNAVPTELYIDDNETRADEDDSIGVVRIPGGLPWDRATQFTCFINGDDTVTYTLIVKFYFTPTFKV